MVFSIKNSLVAIVGTLVVFSAADTNHCTARGIHQCSLTPQQIEGPYFILDIQYRSNIREDRLGIPFGVDLVVQDTNTCEPVEGLIVHLWAADALGIYSGFSNFDGDYRKRRNPPTDDKRFLRGHQITDSNGSVHFDLIIPGWYDGRCPHIHIETFLPTANGDINQTIHTTQAYFPNELFASFKNKSAYIDNQNVMTLNEEDDVFRFSGKGEKLIMDIKPVSENPDTDGYFAKMVLGIELECALKSNEALIEYKRRSQKFEREMEHGATNKTTIPAVVVVFAVIFIITLLVWSIWMRKIKKERYRNPENISRNRERRSS